MLLSAVSPQLSLSFVDTVLASPYRFTLATSRMDTWLGGAGQVERGLPGVAECTRSVTKLDRLQ